MEANSAKRFFPHINFVKRTVLQKLILVNRAKCYDKIMRNNLKGMWEKSQNKTDSTEWVVSKIKKIASDESTFFNTSPL